MAKQLIIGSITKLEEVLDLVTDPEKYVQYMKDLKEAHALIVEKLDWVKTKEEAEQLLADARNEAEKSAVDIKKHYNELHEKEQEFAKNRSEHYAKLDKSIAEFEEKAQALNTLSKAHNAEYEEFSGYEREARKKLHEQQVEVTELQNKYTKLVAEAQEKKVKAEALLKAL